jgi:Oxidoreductase molybdopterin binding domain
MSSRTSLRKKSSVLLTLMTSCASCVALNAYADSPAAAPVGATKLALSVSVENGKSATLDLAALEKLPQRTVHAEAHGNAVTCTGPTLGDVLGSVGVVQGEALRGKNLTLYVRAGAADGYHAVFALAELDPGFRSEVPIVTARCDDKPLDAKDGPLRIVVPGDKRPARWVRQLNALDVLAAPAGDSAHNKK